MATDSENIDLVMSSDENLKLEKDAEESVKVMELVSSAVDESKEYFESYEDLDVHRLMLRDTVRTYAYMKAINNAEGLFKGKIVMDVGAGTGILSLFSAKAGAKKVFAVEASGLASTIAEVASLNGFGEIISVIHSRVEDIKSLSDSPDGKVDIIVSEWMGFYLLHESMLDSVLFARDKFLKQGGLMFPNTAQIYAAPCRAPQLWEDHIDFWTSRQHYGFNLNPIGKLARTMKKPEIVMVPADGLLCSPQLLSDINLQTVQYSALQLIHDRRFFSMDQSGDMHAVCIWFTCTFPVAPGKDPVELSTAPESPETHWKQTVILLPEKLEFEDGDVTGWDITFEKTSPTSRSYRIHYECLDSDAEHPVPCDCGLVQCEIIKHYMNHEHNDTVVA